jgi:hypothetical protein
VLLEAKTPEYPLKLKAGGLPAPLAPGYCILMAFHCIQQSSQDQQVHVCSTAISTMCSVGGGGPEGQSAPLPCSSSSSSSSTAVTVAGVQGGSQPPCLAGSSVAATKSLRTLVSYRQTVVFTCQFNLSSLQTLPCVAFRDKLLTRTTSWLNIQRLDAS